MLEFEENLWKKLKLKSKELFKLLLPKLLLNRELKPKLKLKELEMSKSNKELKVNVREELQRHWNSHNKRKLKELLKLQEMKNVLLDKLQEHNKEKQLPWLHKLLLIKLLLKLWRNKDLPMKKKKEEPKRKLIESKNRKKKEKQNFWLKDKKRRKPLRLQELLLKKKLRRKK